MRNVEQSKIKNASHVASPVIVWHVTALPVYNLFYHEEPRYGRHG